MEANLTIEEFNYQVDSDCVSIFEAIFKNSDLVAELLIFFLLLLDWVSRKNWIPSEARLPVTEEEYNWDQLGTVRKLTREQIRAEPGYEDLSDKEVDNIIETNYQLSLICYNNYKANIMAFYVGEY